MRSFDVKVTQAEMLQMSEWPEYGVCCLIDEKLKEMGQPHVGEFTSPDGWWNKILKIYESIGSTVQKTDSTLVFTFREKR